MAAAPHPAAPAPPPPPSPRASYRVEVEADPATATLELDGLAVGDRILRRDLLVDGRKHRLVGRAPGYRDALVTFIDAPPPRRLSLDPVVSPAEKTPTAAPRARAHHHQKVPAPAPAAKPAAPAPTDKPVGNGGVPVID